MCLCGLQFAVLAKLYGLLASSNLVKWKDVIPYAMLPYSESRFWTSANAAYRNFAVLFLANILEVSIASMCAHVAFFLVINQ